MDLSTKASQNRREEDMEIDTEVNTSGQQENTNDDSGTVPDMSVHSDPDSPSHLLSNVDYDTDDLQRVSHFSPLSDCFSLPSNDEDGFDNGSKLRELSRNESTECCSYETEMREAISDAIAQTRDMSTRYQQRCFQSSFSNVQKSDDESSMDSTTARSLFSQQAPVQSATGPLTASKGQNLFDTTSSYYRHLYHHVYLLCERAKVMKLKVSYLEKYTSRILKFKWVSKDDLSYVHTKMEGILGDDYIEELSRSDLDETTSSSIPLESEGECDTSEVSASDNNTSDLSEYEMASTEGFSTENSDANGEIICETPTLPHMNVFLEQNPEQSSQEKVTEVRDKYDNPVITSGLTGDGHTSQGVDISEEQGGNEGKIKDIVSEQLSTPMELALPEEQDIPSHVQTSSPNEENSVVVYSPQVKVVSSKQDNAVAICDNPEVMEGIHDSTLATAPPPLPRLPTRTRSAVAILSTSSPSFQFNKNFNTTMPHQFFDRRLDDPSYVIGYVVMDDPSTGRRIKFDIRNKDVKDNLVSTFNVYFSTTYPLFIWHIAFNF